MNFRKILFVSAAVLMCTASISASAISHTFVSRSGLDSNPCTSALPCLTFQGALSKTAVAGLITALDAGDFGPVQITQAVTIDGNNLGSITFNDDNIAVDISASADVAVQNLTINGVGSGGVGIQAYGGGNLIVDNCKITNFTAAAIYFIGAGNMTIENSRIDFMIGVSNGGIFIAGNGAENVVLKNTVIDASPFSNTNTGFYIGSGPGPVNASLQNVTIMGAGAEAVDARLGLTQITGSVLTQSNYGVYAEYGATVSVASSLITANSTAVFSNTSSKIRLDNNDIYDNTTAIGNCGGIVKTSTTNKTSGTISIPAADVSDSVTF